MIRRAQQDRRKVRRARQEAEAALTSSQGTYRPDRDICWQRSWEAPYDDANTVRLQFVVWHRGKTLADFVVNVQILGSDGWDTLEYFDCCHGHCHLHAKNSELDPIPIARLDTTTDVQRAFAQVERAAHERARTIRNEEL